MNSISNYCRFIGRLMRDPKLIKLDHTDLVTFTLAINEYRQEKDPDTGDKRKKKTVSYFDFEAWDTGATTLANLCKKGDIVDIVSSAKNNRWVDKNGKEQNQIRFRVKEFKLFNQQQYAREEVQTTNNES